MALGYLEYYDMVRKLKWERCEWKSKELRDLIRQHQMIPKVGDLLVDYEFPEDAIAVVIEVIDRRKSKPYLLHTPDGTDWFEREYVEYMTVRAEDYRDQDLPVDKVTSLCYHGINPDTPEKILKGSP